MTDLPQEDLDKKLATQRTLYYAVFQASPDALIIVDAEGIVLAFNRQACLMFGYGSGDVEGKLVEMLLPEGFREVHETHRAKYMLEPRIREMGIGLVLRGRHHNGQEFPVQISLGPIATTEGVYVLAVVRRQDS